MQTEAKRTIIARVMTALVFLCGVIELPAGLAEQLWKLGAMGWFTGGALLMAIALVVLVDGAVAYEKRQKN